MLLLLKISLYFYFAIKVSVLVSTLFDSQVKLDLKLELN